jgi:hypothetical protein
MTACLVPTVIIQVYGASQTLGCISQQQTNTCWRQPATSSKHKDRAQAPSHLGVGVRSRVLVQVESLSHLVSGVLVGGIHHRLNDAPVSVALGVRDGGALLEAHLLAHIISRLEGSLQSSQGGRGGQRGTERGGFFEAATLVRLVQQLGHGSWSRPSVQGSLHVAHGSWRAACLDVGNQQLLDHDGAALHHSPRCASFMLSGVTQTS